MASYVFPSSLTSINSKAINKANQPFIHMMLYDWNLSNKLEQTPKDITTAIAEYFIAIPETSIQEQYNHSWESEIDTSQLLLGSLSRKFKGFLGWVSQAPLLGDVVEAGEAHTGKFFNDFVKQNYKGLDFRQFEFLFNLIPKNLSEANTIKSIMTTLKQYTTPVYEGGLVRYPAIVKFVVYSGSANNIPLFKSMYCGVQSLSFNYSPSGFMRTFQDGNVVQIHMNISLKELKRVNSAELLK